MITSWSAPRTQRTTFTSACGARWKCMPRSVPARRLCEWFDCGKRVSSPALANSSAQKVRAK